MKIEIWRTLSPCSDPQTEAIPNIAENTPPVSSMPTQPRGEMRNSRAKLSPLFDANVGAGVGASSTGRNASDTSTEGITNNSNPAGSATFSSACEAMMPTICTIM